MEYYGDAFGLKTISLLDFLGHSASLRPQTISKVITELREAQNGTSIHHLEGRLLILLNVIHVF